MLATYIALQLLLTIPRAAAVDAPVRIGDVTGLSAEMQASLSYYCPVSGYSLIVSS